VTQVRFEHDGPITTLVLDRPDQRNAMTPEMLDAVLKGLGALPPSARCLVVAGTGKVFCAGFDLAMCQAHPDGSVMRALLTGLSRCILALRQLPVPVVAAPHGAAIAGGCAILGGADIVVADRAAKFGYPVVRLGVSPAVSAPFFTGAVGHGHARGRLLDPSIIEGAEAHRIGLVHELVDAPEEVRPRARAIAASLAAKPRGALGATRALLLEIEALGTQPAKALEVSLGLAGSDEERQRLAPALRRP
jgi:methylglutaconyl-CoA hydratase